MGKIYRGRAYHNGIEFETKKEGIKIEINRENEIILNKWKYNFVKRKLIYNLPFVCYIIEFINKYKFSIFCLMCLDILMLIFPRILNFDFTSTRDGRMIAISIFTLYFIGIFTICNFYIFKVNKRGKVTSGFHGAEHKVIYAAEHGIPLTLEEVKKCPRISRYCGTNVMVISTFLKILIFDLILYYTGAPSFSISILLADALSRQLFFMKNSEKNLFMKLFFCLGTWQQKYITTSEPTDKQLKLAIRGMEQLKKYEARNQTALPKIAA